MICPHCNNENGILSFYCEKCLKKCFDISVFEFDKSFLSNLEKTDEKNVFSYNSIFLILNEINNAFYNFGEFIDYSEAVNKKKELEQDGWPLPIDIVKKEEIVSSNILKKDNKFQVFNDIEGKRKIFGVFDTKSEAIKAKYDLIANKWHIKEKKFKNIDKTPSGSFCLRKKLKGGSEIRFGTFDSLEDATFIKTLVESRNWDISKFGQDAEIYENDGIFYLIKVNKKNKFKILGKYDSLEKAEVYRDLDQNPDAERSGKIDGGYSANAFKYAGNVYYINNKFHVQKNFDNNRLVFGKFASEDVANILRDILVDNDWDINFFKKNNIFSVDDEYYNFKLIKDEIGYLGKYKSRSDAERNLNNSLFDFESDETVEKIEVGPKCFIKQTGGKFNVQIKRGWKNIIFGRFSSENTANFVKNILNNNNLNIDYFKNHNIFSINEKFYVFAVKKESILFLGMFMSEEIAKKRLKKFNNINDLDYEVSFSVCE